MNDIDDHIETDGTAIDWDSECLTNWADPTEWVFARILALVVMVLVAAAGALARVL